jgi:hypothetical protein
VSSPSTTAIGDSTGFIQRLANAFGTPNANITLDICGWGRTFATRYTYGIGSLGGSSGGAMPDIVGVLRCPSRTTRAGPSSPWTKIARSLPEGLACTHAG